MLAATLLAVWTYTSATESTEPDVGFPVGEELTYRIYWGIVPVGYSVASTKWIEEDGRKLLAITFRTRTNKVLATIYAVDDLFESVIDPLTFLPVAFMKKQSEGRYHSHELTTFDYDTLTAYWTSFLNRGEKNYDIRPDTRDLVTFMYYMRNKTWQEGQTVKTQVMTDEKLYDLEVAVKKRETVKTVQGEKIPSIKLEPRAKFNGLFVRKGKGYLWVSEERPSVVTKITAKIPVASIKLILDRPKPARR